MLRWVGVAVAAVVGLVALAASATVFLGQEALEERLAQLERRTGLNIAVDGVSVDLDAGVRLDGVRVRGPGALAPWSASIDHVATDLDLGSLVRGKRRPGRVWLQGVHLQGLIDRATIDAALQFVRRTPPGEPGSPAGPSAMPRVTIKRASGHIDVALALEGDPTPQRVALSGWSGDVTFPGGLAVKLAGQLQVGPTTRRVELGLQGGLSGDVTVRLDGPLGVSSTVSGREVQLQASGFERRSSGVAATQFVLRSPRDGVIVACDRLEAALPSSDSTDWTAVQSATCTELRAAVGERHVETRRATLEFHDGADEPNQLRPRRARLEGLRLRGSTADRAEATVQRLGVLFGPEALAAAARGDWATAIRGVTIRGPALHVTVPDLDAPLQPLQAAADAVPIDPEAGPPDDQLDDDAKDASDARTARAGEGKTRRRKDGKSKARSVPPVELPLPPATAFRIPFGRQMVEYARQTQFTIKRGRVEVSGDKSKAGQALVLDDLEMVLTPSDSGGVTAAVHSLLQRGNVQSGRATVTAEIDPDGSVRAARGVVAGTDFAHVLSRLSQYATVQPDAWVQLDFDYNYAEDVPIEGVPTAGRSKRRSRNKAQPEPATGPRHRVRGQARFEDFGLEAWRISHTPMTGLEGRVEYDLTIHPTEHHVRVQLPKIVLGESTLTASMSMTARPDDGLVLDLQATMPMQDCAAMARSIPRALMPRLAGLQLAGAIAWQASLQVDIDRPYDLELNVEGDVDSCRVVTLGDEIDLEDLRGPFIHHPIEPKKGVREDIEVGRGSSSWVPGNQLPRFVKAAAIVTEDRSFYAHAGLRWDLVVRALKLNIEKGRFVYGGSTITQQLVKNLYLTREKTLSRKLEELFIVWEMERRFTKEEILELYVNVIEYGPDLYGVRRAAHFYFGKPPGALSPSEASFIMGLKPYPGAGHRQWVSQRLNRWWVSRVEHVLGMIHRREGAISQAEVLAGGARTIKFRSPGGSLWGGGEYVRPSKPLPPPPGAPHEPPMP